MTEPTLSISDFITRWQQSSASERANCQSFLNELCEVLGVPKPQPAQNNPESDAYVYERAVTADQLAKAFVRGRADAVESLLETLVSLGLAREVEDGKFAA